MSVRVFLPGQLRAYAPAEVLAEGATVDAVLRDLDTRFPGLRFRVIDEQDRLRPHMLLFVGEHRTEDLGHVLADGAAVTLVGALSGG